MRFPGLIATAGALVFAAIGWSGSYAADQQGAAPQSRLPPAWLEASEPFRIIGDVYYVGSRGLGMYFIPTPQGHILIDGGLPENAAMIVASIRQLGFAPEDIRILLNTHAHFDHSGGLSELQRLSGAQMIASEGDRSALEGGFYLGSEDQHALDAPQVKVNRVIADAQTVKLGGVELTAHMTPGHTRGCTSWTTTVSEAGKSYEVLIFCSATVALNRLVNPPQYAGIVADYRATFDKTRDWEPDVFLSNHAEFFALDAKRQRQIDGDALAFVNRQEFPRFIANAEDDFKAELIKQQAPPVQ